ncbi:MAG: CubicO group peptidase (beta-lactamase class C family) [Paraglaciecola sp.]|jgi:CubicO group peptidase (beta-lactamase class C family)
MEEGKLDVDAPINDYLDGFAIPDAFDRQITMRDLMAHRPGFEENVKNSGYSNPDISLKEAAATNIPARVAPAGDRTIYSNSGSNLAAYVVEEVSGMSYFDFVETRILNPIGLRSTTLRDIGVERNPTALEQRVAKPHRIADDAPVLSEYSKIRPNEAVGSAAMDAKDAAIFMRMLLNNTQYEGGRLLLPSSWERIKTHAFADANGGDDMGWGFMLNGIDGFAMMGHSGATGSFLTSMFVLPELNMGVFVSFNGRTESGRPDAIARAIIRKITNTGSLESFLAIKGDTETANEIAGNYINNRQAFSGIATLLTLGSDFTVSATQDGYLLVHRSSTERYAPLNQDVWVSKTGARLSIFRNDEGEVLRLQSSGGTTTFERIPFSSTSNALLIGFGGVLVLCITALLGMYYRHGRALNPSFSEKTLAWVNVLSVVSWLALFICVGLGFYAMQSFRFGRSEFPPLGFEGSSLLSIWIAIQTLIHFLSMAFAWKTSTWGMWRRIHFTLLGVLSVYAVYLLYHWHLIGA